MKIFENLLYPFCALLMLVSCATDLEESTRPEFSTVPISFGASDDAESVTRGNEIGSGWSHEDNSKMAMWAYFFESGSSTPQSMMQEQVLTYSGTNARWEYSPIIFWPKSGTMDFFSYAPARIIGGDGKYVTPNAREEFTTFSPSHINHQAILMNCHVPASQITSTTQLETLAKTKNVNDAANQFDLMFAFQRNVKCAEQTVSSKVNMKFAHVMAGIKFGVKEGDTFNLPAGTTKVVFSIGRLKTGGTLAICEPPTPEAEPGVVWTLDGQEGTFYYTVPIVGGSIVFTSEEFFFPPQDIEQGLVVTAYFYDGEGKKNQTDFRTVRTDIKKLERGKCTVLKLTSKP